MKSVILLMFLLAFPVQLFAEDKVQNIAMDETNWQLSEKGAQFVNVDNVQAIRLKAGTAQLLDRKFSSGIIEFDIKFTLDRGFMGIAFRANENQDTAEYFYFRSHQKNNPDANQYTPIFNNNSAWQLFYGEQYATAIDYNNNTWQHVKILVHGDEAEFYLDSDKPFLHVDDLHTDRKTGGIYLIANFNQAEFSNFSITESEKIEFLGKTKDYAPAPDGLIPAWDVSTKTVGYDDLGTKLDIDQSALEWTTVSVEKNHIANISRVVRRTSDKNTAIVRLNISSDSPAIKQLNFGFSDYVKVYVNGLLVYEGRDGFTSRDYRYLGTVGLWDSLYLNLNKGDNEIIFAIRENFGGWGIIGTMPDQAGLTLH